MAGVGPVRNRKKQVRWRRIVRGQAGSGLSVRAYRKLGVKDSAYYWWRAQLARRDRSRRLRPPRLCRWWSPRSRRVVRAAVAGRSRSYGPAVGRCG